MCKPELISGHCLVAVSILFLLLPEVWSGTSGPYEVPEKPACFSARAICGARPSFTWGNNYTLLLGILHFFETEFQVDTVFFTSCPKPPRWFSVIYRAFSPLSCAEDCSGDE